MSKGPVYIVSDLHLGAVPPETEAAFCSWLDQAREASRVVINGDLFDFWYEYRSVIPRGHTRVLGALARLVDSGVEVDFMGGNHDWWGGTFLEHEIGMQVHKEPVTMELAGRKALLAHGDGLGRGDLGYRVLRRVLRGRVTQWAFRWLHPDVGASVARRVSRTVIRGDAPTEREQARADRLREWALKQLESRPELDLVVLGHSHMPEMVTTDRGAWYLNTGDWLRHRTWAILERGCAPRLEDWSSPSRSSAS